MTKARFNLLVLKELMHGRCGCLVSGKYVNICFPHAPPDIQKQLVSNVEEESK